MSTPREDNVGLDVAEWICERYGFAPVETKSTGWFVRHMDPQNSVLVALTPWEETPPGGGGSIGVQFGVSRRDITDLRADLYGNLPMPYMWTTLEQPLRFFGQPFGHWAFHHDRAMISDWVDTWVPRLIEQAPSLRFVEQWWDQTRPAGDDEAAMRMWQGSTRVPRVCNQLLWGWTDEAESELLEPVVAMVDRLGVDHKHYEKRSAQLSRIRAWIADHPNGLARTFVD